MFASGLARFVRRHSRSALVWAAIPLVVFNGRTLVGCGCTGHFESVCHCNCCSNEDNAGNRRHAQSARPCCAGHAFKADQCSCCNHREATHRCTMAEQERDSSSTNGAALKGPCCISIVLHDVIPATVASSMDASELQPSIFVLADFNLPTSDSQSHVVQVVDFDTGPPPNDLVVTLHRLVI